MTDNPEPPSGRSGGSSQPVDDQVTVVPSSGRVSDVAVVQHFLRLGSDSDDSSASGSASLMRWIAATTRPGVTVSLGGGDSEELQAIRAALAETGAGARYIAVGTGDRPVDGEPGPHDTRVDASPRTIFEVFDSEEDADRSRS